MSQVIGITILIVVAVIAWIVWTPWKSKEALNKKALDKDALDDPLDPHDIERQHYEERMRVERAAGAKH